MMKPCTVRGLVLLMSIPFAGSAQAQMAQEAVNLEVVRKIREEGLQRSQIESLARYLTEVIGPRLTGSPGMKRANEWTAEMFREWGLENVSIEPWGEFGLGWQQEEFQGRILTPYSQPLQGQPLAWSGSTDGLVRGPVVIVSADSVEQLEQYRGKLKGAFVMTDAPQDVTPEFEHRDRRTALEDLLEPPAPRQRGGAGAPDQAARQARFAQFRARRAVANAASEMARSEGALALIRISSRGDGVISGSSGGSREPGADPMAQVMITREQYNQIHRNLTAGIPVELEMSVKNRFFDDDLKQYNTLAEIPGSDKAHEYVMIGAHLDSWQMGNGATDNAAGSVMRPVP